MRRFLQPLCLFVTLLVLFPIAGLAEPPALSFKREPHPFPKHDISELLGIRTQVINLSFATPVPGLDMVGELYTPSGPAPKVLFQQGIELAKPLQEFAFTLHVADTDHLNLKTQPAGMTLLSHRILASDGSVSGGTTLVPNTNFASVASFSAGIFPGGAEPFSGKRALIYILGDSKSHSSVFADSVEALRKVNPDRPILVISVGERRE